MDVAAQPGRGIGRDIGRGEAVERELDAFISKRHEQRVKTEGERQIEEAWKESVRAYEEKRRQVARLEWRAFHCAQAERHRAALRRAANEPKPEKQPEWEPETPELRAEVLVDRLAERDADLAKEQERRRRRRG